MNFKWFGPLALLAALVIGDQIRINRPAHKYRLTVEVETPEGRKSASGVMAVHPDRSYSPPRPDPHRWATPFSSISGSGKNLVALLAHVDRNLVLDDINYVALRAYTAAAGKRVLVQRDEPADRHRAGEGRADPGARQPSPIRPNPGTARVVPPDDAEAVLGKGYRLQGITAEVVPNGYWPLDFGGALGEPVTRGIQAKLPWLNGAGNAAATALRAAGLPGVDGDRRPGGLHAKIAGQARCSAVGY